MKRGSYLRVYLKCLLYLNREFTFSSRSTIYGASFQKTIYGASFTENHLRSIIYGKPFSEHHFRSTIFGAPFSEHHFRSIFPENHLGTPFSEHHFRKTIFGAPFRSTIYGAPFSENHLQNTTLEKNPLGNVLLDNQVIDYKFLPFRRVFSHVKLQELFQQILLPHGNLVEPYIFSNKISELIW